MKKVFLALLPAKKGVIIFAGIFFICSVSFSQTGWFTQSSGTSEHLQSVCFVNDLTGWAVGLAGDIITTGNGGTTWILQTTGSTSALNSVYFISALTGWAAGEFMTVLKTTNGGTNWIPILSSSLSIKSVFFNNSLVGYIAGNGFLYKTTNGGLNWSASVSNTAWSIYSVHFPAGSTTTGYAVGMGTPSPPILKSTDSGVNWSIQPVPLGNALNSVFFTSVTTGWAAGWIGSIMYTSNGGTNWSDQTSGTSNSLRSIYFANSLTGWAVGDLGTILKTTSGGITSILQTGNFIPEHCSLSQNYPNPFNPVTKIKFDVVSVNQASLLVTLRVFDIIGKEVSMLVNEKLQPGTYEVTFDASNLPSGIYFYQLKTEYFSETKKLTLLK